MLLPVTTLTASMIALLFIGLSLRVINMRRTGIGPAVGLNEDERFLRAVRAHANAAEYVPLFLILLGLYELAGGSKVWLVSGATLFVLSRILHAIGFGFIGTGPWRVLGMIGTNTAILLFVILNLWLFV